MGSGVKREDSASLRLQSERIRAYPGDVSRATVTCGIVGDASHLSPERMTARENRLLWTFTRTVS